MAISDDLNSIRTHLEDDYTALEQLGVSVEDRNIENIKDMANQIYAKFPKTSYAEGSNITLSNTLKGKLDFENDIAGYGDTSQKSYSGKNLYPSGTSTQTIAGITFTPQADGGIKLQGTSTYSNYYVAGGESNYVDVPNLSNLAEAVTLSVSGMQEGIQVYVVGATLGAKGTSVSGSIGFTTTANDKYRLFIRVMANNTVNTTLYIQLEKGSSATSFEKYVGGQASPNSSYPQDIEVVRGKNRLKVINNASGNANGISWVKNSDNSFTFNGTADGNFTLVVSGADWQNEITNGETYTISGCPSGGSDSTYRIQAFNFNGTSVPTDTGSGVTSVANLSSGSNIAIRVFSGVSVNNLTFKPMIEKGSQATSYLPYNTLEVVERGKNLFNKDITPENYYYNASGEKVAGATSSETYINQEYYLRNTSITISRTSITGGQNIRICEYNGNTFIKRTVTNSNGTITLDSNTTRVIFSVNSSTTQYFTDLQIETGSTATTYEPYQTPQTYQLSLGNYKPSKIGNYKDYFYRTSGKNLISGVEFGKYSETTGEKLDDNSIYRNTEPIPIKPSTTYTFSINGTSQGINKFFYDSNMNFISKANDTNATFTTSSNAYYLNIYRGTSLGNTGWQIELGSSATDYQPYGSGEWYFKGKINNKELNGSETWALDVTYNRFSSTTTITDYDISNRTSALCSHYKYNGTPYFALSGSGNYLFFGFPNENTTTLATWEAWLSTNKPSVFYILAIPTDTKITDTTMISQLEDIYNMQSVNGTTIIEINGNLPMIMKVRALKNG